ncbi:hypothetical protein BKG83_17520 [Mycobacteroides chelonae]|uniref:DUF1508 domain-containing protein n=2 Tax=Mycobacteroides TaxID=670516 RepID=A0A1S1LX65_MYCCH|nr:MULTISPECIES: hypothetical protein [Mycobacteroides]OHU55974.1 hypothetical protein BKG83_17520 [Mycobacteroides chelonae]OHU75941.1 hypothetical protein BKG84_25550 [Mycobacteroides chelonae]SKL82452.1 Uncharacterised protein [Mycobacteroides abscessus subsp. massiliense]SKS92485.1 Uncharacterised protein [Mycobacteroides abscessus subsp. massiliense]SKT19637.1 Uncharacterised protein [Mycobacteroides abscessus subsp. massiliense]
MSKAKPVPGTVEAFPRKDNDGFAWKWTSPKGNEHFNYGPYPTKAAAAAAGRKFARNFTAKPTHTPPEPEDE